MFAGHIHFALFRIKDEHSYCNDAGIVVGHCNSVNRDPRGRGNEARLHWSENPRSLGN